MASAQNITIEVTSLAGSYLATMHAVDITCTTCAELKQMVAKAIGFFLPGTRLMLASGVQIEGQQLLSELLTTDLPIANVLTVSAVLVKSELFGSKSSECTRPLSTLPTALVCQPVWRQGMWKQGKPMLETLRTPKESLREPVQFLLTSRFGPEVTPLIESALALAYDQLLPTTGNADKKQKTSGTSEGQAPKHGLVFEDAARATYADLSTCQLWIRASKVEACLENLDQNTRRLLWHRSVHAAVLWRLLFSSEGSSGSALENTGLDGPVLEVLFLSTQYCQGDATALLSDLEDEARARGCAAICTTAANSAEATSFWKPLGFSVEVPVKACEDGDAAEPEPEQEPEPSTALGRYLSRKMVLFTDTPVVAKVLK